MSVFGVISKEWVTLERVREKASLLLLPSASTSRLFLRTVLSLAMVWKGRWPVRRVNRKRVKWCGRIILQVQNGREHGGSVVHHVL